MTRDTYTISSPAFHAIRLLCWNWQKKRKIKTSQLVLEEDKYADDRLIRALSQQEAERLQDELIKNLSGSRFCF